MVFTSRKCRRKAFCIWSCGDTLAEVFRKLALQRESKVEEGHLMPDHVHMLLRARSTCAGLSRAQAQLHGTALLGAGFFVNTVGRDGGAIRAYVRNQ